MDKQRNLFLSDVFSPIYEHYSHLYISCWGRSLFSPERCEKLLEIRIDVVQRFPCLRGDGFSEMRDKPGILILTNLRFIFLPYRLRSEKLLRLRFARLDINGEGKYILLSVSFMYVSPCIPNLLYVMTCGSGKISPLDLIRRSGVDGGEDVVNTSILSAFQIKDGRDTINLEEFLAFMGVSQGDVQSVRSATVQLPVCAVSNIEHVPVEDGTALGNVSSPLASDKNLELISVSIPAYEDITGSWENFDVKKMYKFDYKFEDYKFEYRVYIIQIALGDIRWTVQRRYSAFESLHSALSVRLLHLQLPDLPAKTPGIEAWPVFSTHGYTNFLADRQEALEKFLCHLVRLQEVWEQGCLLQRFLDNSEDFENFERMNEYLAKHSQLGTGQPGSNNFISHHSTSYRILNIPLPCIRIVVPSAISSYSSVGEGTLVEDALDLDDADVADVEGLPPQVQSFLDVRNLLRSGGRRIAHNSKLLDPRESLIISTNCGGEYTFEIGGNLDTALVENRYACDGSLTNSAWCKRFKEQVRQ